MASYLPYLGLAMWFEYFININTDTALNVLCGTLDILVLINFLTIVAFPGGLYKIQSYQATPYTCWFLGYKNPQVRFLLPYIALSLARNIIQHGRLSQLTYIRLGIAVFTTLFLKSTTGLVGTVLFFTLLYVFNSTGHGFFNKVMTRLLNIRMVFVVASVISVLFILFNFQNNLSFLIVNVLHKDLDLTDRIYVWENVIPYIRRSPIIGNGVLHAILSRKLIGASHAHNYLLNTLYNGGLVSLAAIVAGWFSAGKETQKYIDHKAIVILACVASAFCIMGISESLTSSVLLYPILAALCNAKKLTEAEWVSQTSEDIQKGQVGVLCA
jgi:O-antigen ligase